MMPGTCRQESLPGDTDGNVVGAVCGMVEFDDDGLAEAEIHREGITASALPG